MFCVCNSQDIDTVDSIKLFARLVFPVNISFFNISWNIILSLFYASNEINCQLTDVLIKSIDINLHENDYVHFDYNILWRFTSTE